MHKTTSVHAGILIFSAHSIMMMAIFGELPVITTARAVMTSPRSCGGLQGGLFERRSDGDRSGVDGVVRSSARRGWAILVWFKFVVVLWWWCSSAEKRHYDFFQELSTSQGVGVRP
jgi:hypothetical protein